jgi:hypothetical protein
MTIMLLSVVYWGNATPPAIPDVLQDSHNDSIAHHWAICSDLNYLLVICTVLARSPWLHACMMCICMSIRVLLECGIGKRQVLGQSSACETSDMVRNMFTGISCLVIVVVMANCLEELRRK